MSVQANNPVITGLQNMVTAQQAVTPAKIKHTSYDTMSPYERVQLTRDVSVAKHSENVFNYDGKYSDDLSSSFIEAIRLEVANEKIAMKQKAMEQKLKDRERRNKVWDSWQIAGSPKVNQQPTEDYNPDATIGTRAYKWLNNLKAPNGLWYAEYQPVRGGDTRKFYNISDHEWSDDYQIRFVCDNCSRAFQSMTPQGNEHCPHCGSDKVTYRGRQW